MRLLLIVFCAPLFAPNALAEGLRFPLACDLGETCWIQNWVDADPGIGRADPQCGPLSYDGHDGIDVRVTYRDMRAGVQVQAPAAGVVRATRSDAPEGGPPAEGQDCGNGVRIDHGGGLETQLCHMARGSVSVRNGQTVAAGQPVGRVGLSGRTEFPHLHVTVRRNGAPIDPFTNRAAGTYACRTGAQATPGPFVKPLAYVDSAIIDAGFIEQAPTTPAYADRLPPATGLRSAPALVGYALILGPRAGATTRLRLLKPSGEVLAEQTIRHDRTQAQYALFAGRNRPPGMFSTGVYRLEVRYERPNGATLDRLETLVLR